ncbi:PLAC8 family protein [Striga asiatica]|uniref:PLAC8 family protein n=1 Tax=Striga asiatica TaxID=4170 RepID=A0A5A7QNU7_STRAF|nr:PLAC8 family protein [Striga asiatica]
MAEEISHPSRYVKLTKEQAPTEDINPGELNLPIDVPQLHVPKCHECGQALPESYQAPADEPWTTGIFECAQDPESRTGLFCPCILFGRNIEQLREDTPWTGPCIFHAIFIEGGLALAAGTAALNGLIDPRTICLITEGLFFSWWMCGIYTGLVRQSLQKKYHLKNLEGYKFVAANFEFIRSVSVVDLIPLITFDLVIRSKNSPCDPCMVHCCLHWCAICQEHRELKGRLSDDTPMPMTIVNPPPVQEMNASIDSHHSALPPANGGEQVNVEMQAL